MKNDMEAPYNLFAQASDTVHVGIVPGLRTRLQVLQNEGFRKITSHFEIELAEPGRSKCTYFIILSDHFHLMARINNRKFKTRWLSL